MDASKDTFGHIHLKDSETVEGDTGRLARWVQLVRRIGGKYGP